MERFFPKEKIVYTGNPVRSDIEQMRCTREEGCAYFGLEMGRRVTLSVGGSLGARSINQMIIKNLNFFKDNDIQIVWQTGKWMYEEAAEAVKNAGLDRWIKVHQFISRMDMAYAAADMVISRAGAIAISELCLVGKPVILIPSPNVAEDHQTKNAMALVNKGAALMVKDADCVTQGLPMALELLNDGTRCEQMSQAIRSMAAPKAADKIVDQIDKLLKK
jgi:UDP-N-acetylglucosamine--N-acetylmuramyl-(pentapeptide) pyrophosphoryl-undecaprenol N-acetylglucosamine transferase